MIGFFFAFLFTPLSSEEMPTDQEATIQMEDVRQETGKQEEQKTKSEGIPEKELEMEFEAKKEGKTEEIPAEESKEETEDEVSGDMTVHFLDVEQGLSILVKSGDDVLIYDGGDRGTSSFVVSYLKKVGVDSIDYLISSHYDADHLNGLIGCLNAFPVEHVISSNYVHDSKTYRSFVDTVKAKGLTMEHPEVGTEYAFGTGSFTILSPERIDVDDSNANSVAIKVVNGENSFIFTGDADVKSEGTMCRSGIQLDCDVLSLGHHGSASSTSWEFLEKTLPEYAVLSCGAGNSYGHPDIDVMEKLKAMEIEVFRSDKQETVIAKSDGKTITWDKEPCNDYSPGDPEDQGTLPAGGSSGDGNAAGAEADTVQLSKEEAQGQGLEACSKCY